MIRENQANLYSVMIRIEIHKKSHLSQANIYDFPFTILKIKNIHSAFQRLWDDKYFLIKTY
jgi:hypothetical protein